MKIIHCTTHFFSYQRMNVKKNTLPNYEFILGRFQKYFGDIDLSIISSEDILAFMSTITDETSQNTKKLRFTLISAFFNFAKNPPATFASRSGTSLEIVLKVLLRYSNLSTTQRYQGKISDAEAMRWIDNLHG